MNVLIVEDEKYARQEMIRLLAEIDPQIKIAGTTESVQETVTWLQSNTPELIFLDIHLADDLSFKIFDKVVVNCPIIFTTAYDQYALRAFKVNSIDYLLKPIEKEELEQAIDQFKSLQAAQNIDFNKILASLDQQQKKTYRKRFLVQRRDKLLSIQDQEIAYFEGEDRYVYLIKKDGSKYIINEKLSDLEDLLDPKEFFRLNRSFIAHFSAIDRMIAMSKSRVKVELSPAASRDIMVSTDNTRLFKEWLNR